VQWNFGTFLWSTVIFFFWFCVIWMFIALFADVFRRNISGWAKAGWVILMVIFPFIGVLAYLIARPKTEDADLLMYSSRPAPQAAQHNAVDEIAKAAELRDQGRITAAEFETIKQHALSY
jgi:Phospholipase_D-nuclease N-terminal